MSIPYRTRRFLKGLLTVLLVLVLLLVLVWGVWILWLDRFVVYSRDGARLDFDLEEPQSGELATPPEAGNPISIYYMGQYISKLYLESKHRPHYIVSDTNVEDAKKIK